MKYPKFNVIIRITGFDQDGEESAHLTVKLSVSREEIMRAGYPPNIQILAQQLEYFTKRTEDQPEDQPEP